jgi:hypothetical protein
MPCILQHLRKRCYRVEMAEARNARKEETHCSLFQPSSLSLPGNTIILFGLAIWPWPEVMLFAGGSGGGWYSNGALRLGMRRTSQHVSRTPETLKELQAF